MPTAQQASDDIRFMGRAIALAKARMGQTWPNPAVGCVIVKDGEVVVTRELLFHIHEVLVHRVQTAGKHPAEVESNRRILLEELRRFINDMKSRGHHRTDGGRVWHAHESRQIAKNGAALIHLCHNDVILHDFHSTIDQEIEMPGVLSLAEDMVTRVVVFHWISLKGG